MNTAQRLASAAKRHAWMLTGNPVWRAFAANPLAQSKQMDLSLAAHAAFDEIITGRGLEDHIDTLACAANVCLVLAERGYGPECEPKIVAAQAAIMRIKARRARGLGIGLDGLGAQDLRDLLATHEQQIKHAGQVTVTDALREVIARADAGWVMEAAPCQSSAMPSL